MWAGPTKIRLTCANIAEVKRDVIACYKYMREINVKEKKKKKENQQQQKLNLKDNIGSRTKEFTYPWMNLGWKLEQGFLPGDKQGPE